ncbi:MAG: type II toxin-antitoxin system HigB family toxin [Steroidobacteraceae bacterium]
MRVISREALRHFWESASGRTDARRALEAWYREARRATWTSPQDIKRMYASASVLQGGRVVFNICGNRYRLVVHIDYRHRTVFVRFVGTHGDYDSIDAEVV